MDRSAYSIRDIARVGLDVILADEYPGRLVMREDFQPDKLIIPADTCVAIIPRTVDRLHVRGNTLANVGDTWFYVDAYGKRPKSAGAFLRRLIKTIPFNMRVLVLLTKEFQKATISEGGRTSEDRSEGVVISAGTKQATNVDTDDEDFAQNTLLRLPPRVYAAMKKASREQNEDEFNKITKYVIVNLPQLFPSESAQELTILRQAFMVIFDMTDDSEYDVDEEAPQQDVAFRAQRYRYIVHPGCIKKIMEQAIQAGFKPTTYSYATKEDIDNFKQKRTEYKKTGFFAFGTPEEDAIAQAVKLSQYTPTCEAAVQKMAREDATRILFPDITDQRKLLGMYKGNIHTLMDAYYDVETAGASTEEIALLRAAYIRLMVERALLRDQEHGGRPLDGDSSVLRETLDYVVNMAHDGLISEEKAKSTYAMLVRIIMEVEQQ